jgi:hypothetical protein
VFVITILPEWSQPFAEVEYILSMEEKLIRFAPLTEKSPIIDSFPVIFTFPTISKLATLC